MVLSHTLSRHDSSWHFSYYSGCGNLFLIAFDPEGLEAELTKEERAVLCSTLDISVDGLLFLGNDFKMHYYNRDGSRAMCGNGLRCLGHFAHYIGLAKKTFTMQTDVGPRVLILQNDGLVRTDMGNIPTVSQPLANWFSCNTGVPHAVQFNTSLIQTPIEDIARPIRFHPVFGINGTNVSFAKIDKLGIHLRTFERGVEQETGACGTGACAASVIANVILHIPFPHTVHFHSGEKAMIHLEHNRLFLTAACQILGHYSLPNPLKA